MATGAWRELGESWDFNGILGGEGRCARTSGLLCAVLVAVVGAGGAGAGGGNVVGCRAKMVAPGLRVVCIFQDFEGRDVVAGVLHAGVALDCGEFGAGVDTDFDFDGLVVDHLEGDGVAGEIRVVVEGFEVDATDWEKDGSSWLLKIGTSARGTDILFAVFAVELLDGFVELAGEDCAGIDCDDVVGGGLMSAIGLLGLASSV